MYMEIVGFWTEEYLQRKIAKLGKTKEQILVAVEIAASQGEHRDHRVCIIDPARATVENGGAVFNYAISDRDVKDDRALIGSFGIHLNGHFIVRGVIARVGSLRNEVGEPGKLLRPSGRLDISIENLID